MNYNTFIENLEINNIIYTEDMLQKLELYYEALVEYNDHTNLTNIIEKNDVYLKHFFDSVILLKYYNFDTKNVLDMGSGAGFPGIVLAIFTSSAKFTLVESTGKKTKFLESLITKLSLTNVEVINERVEVLAYSRDSQYDFVTARAMASLPILMELSARFLKLQGQLIAYKTVPEVEISGSLKASNKLNLRILEPIKYTLPIENSHRSFIILKKVKPTPKLYPRHYNQIKRNPL